MNLNDALKNMAASPHNVTVMVLFGKMFPNGNFGESAKNRIAKIVELGGTPSQALIDAASREENVGIPTNKMLADYRLTDDELLRIGKTFFNSVRAFSYRKNKGIDESCPYYKLSVEIEERHTDLFQKLRFNNSKSSLDSLAYNIKLMEHKLDRAKADHEIKFKSFLNQYPNYPAYVALMALAKFANDLKNKKLSNNIWCSL